jgi:hypothetical protein
VDVEATQTVDKMNFVSLDDVGLVALYEPYYHPGASIGWRKDTLHIRDVVGISLLSTRVLRFRRKLAPAGSSRRLWRRRDPRCFTARQERMGTQHPRRCASTLLNHVPALAERECRAIFP